MVSDLGRFAFKHILFHSCGYENLTAISNSTIELLIDTIYPTPISLNVSDYFKTSITNCTYTPWLYNKTLVKANNSYPNAEALTDGPLANLNLSGDILTIYKNTPGVMEAFIMISESSTKYAYKHMHFHICGFENLYAKTNSTNIIYDNPVPKEAIFMNLSDHF